ncbi:MAG: acylneuraminate cytidylyltransferase family protein [Marinobacter sp.]|nr:acylneuraminate cytidylyltransferase family protein [Marinobacter sp.]
MNVALIPARGGSKGLPGKNIRSLAGKPLIVWSIEQALASRCVDRVIVSTDDPDIAAVSAEAGADIINRPSDLAGDTATSETAIEHALTVMEQNGQTVDQIIFLQCTSPLRRPHDIDDAFDHYTEKAADSLLSVALSHRFFWKKNTQGWGESINYDYHNRPRRQDMEQAYMENGSIYIFSSQHFRRHHNRLGGRVILHVMPEACAYEIDSETDFQIVELLMQKGDF